ncbi:HNH endonuclease [uncultured Eubacterium sp.]|uniref:HNH endonuclease n=1 Tax=uncultured Eubacterium sp. TaxID=165185 RepID=UPI002672FFAB|nr:HNH endonuclease [uncultured Eubacterium sp.]
MELEQIVDAINTGKAYRIYKTKEWIRLREEVLMECHYECQHCKSKGIIRMAQTVHHVRHVDKYPGLAFSKYYIDKDGQQQRNLIPLCNKCHNEEHDRFKFKKRKREKKKPLTEEFW